MSAMDVIIIDDQQLFRDMLADWLQRSDQVRVVGRFSTCDAVIAAVRKAAPDVVLCETALPGLNCFDATRRIKAMAAGTRVVFLSGHTHDRCIEQALEAGADGYLSKHESPDAVLAALREVAAGREAFSPDIRDRLVQDHTGRRLSGGSATRLSLLSPREMEVLSYIATGLSKKEAAQTMHLSVKTIENHTAKLMQKLEIHDRVDLARYAIREGLCEA